MGRHLPAGLLPQRSAAVRPPRRGDEPHVPKNFNSGWRDRDPSSRLGCALIPGARGFLLVQSVQHLRQSRPKLSYGSRRLVTVRRAWKRRTLAVHQYSRAAKRSHVYPAGERAIPLAVFADGNHDPFENSTPGYLYLCYLLASRSDRDAAGSRFRSSLIATSTPKSSPSICAGW